MDEIQAALLRIKLREIDKWNNKKGMLNFIMTIWGYGFGYSF